MTTKQLIGSGLVIIAAFYLGALYTQMTTQPPYQLFESQAGYFLYMNKTMYSVYPVEEDFVTSYYLEGKPLKNEKTEKPK